MRGARSQIASPVIASFAPAGLAHNDNERNDLGQIPGSPEGQGVLAEYLTGTVFGAVFIAILASVIASLDIFNTAQARQRAA